MPRTFAVVGTHSTRKTTAVGHLAAAAKAAGLSFEVVAEVARTSPLAVNEAATSRSQLWIAMTQVARELEAASRANALITDGALINDFAYYLRAASGRDEFEIRSLVTRWTATTDRFLFLRPDVDAVEDGLRSTEAAFRADIDRELARLLAELVPAWRVREMPSSLVAPDYDWPAILEDLR